MSNSLKPSGKPGYVVGVIAGLLGVDSADIDQTRAFLSASSLLMALGVEPDIDPADTSDAADMVRGLLLESKTRTTTRSRRSL